MADQTSQIGNPLTLMAVFAGVSEAVGAAVLPFVDDPSVQIILVRFVVFFPSVLMAAFFITLWLNPKLLFGLRDLDTDEARLLLLGISKRSEETNSDQASERLRQFLYAGGARNSDNETKLNIWLSNHNINVTPTIFVNGADHAADRLLAVKDLGLE